MWPKRFACVAYGYRTPGCALTSLIQNGPSSGASLSSIVPMNGTASTCVGSTTHGSTCSFACTSDYVMADNTTFTCSNGSWIIPANVTNLPTCQATCGTVTCASRPGYAQRLNVTTASICSGNCNSECCENGMVLFFFYPPGLISLFSTHVFTFRMY